MLSKRICIVGAGPAGFYAAQYLLKHLEHSQIDLIEKLPVPYGLVRFGVAPDHPEVKNVINTFRKTAEHPNLNFYGNVSLGKDVSLRQLRESYHAVLLAYGADQDKKIGLPNENLPSVISAREFVAWYNGLPGTHLQPDLSSKVVTLLGQGNVAIDVARILMSPIGHLENTDITEHALEALKTSRVEQVHLVGRRGPLQAAFTIKELREMLKLPHVQTLWRKDDFEGISEQVPQLERPRKRLTELMLKSLAEQEAPSGRKRFLPIFFRSPKAINGTARVESIDFSVNELKDNKAVATDRVECLETDLICRSIGYKSESVDEELNFDPSRGICRNVNGRVLKKALTGNDQTIDDIENQYEEGLYVTGWLATGPTGVILTTMSTSFGVAERICNDFGRNVIKAQQKMPGVDFKKLRAVSWSGWERIDEMEIHRGSQKDKPREKILQIEEMLKIARV